MRRAPVLALVALLVVLSACGGSDSAAVTSDPDDLAEAMCNAATAAADGDIDAARNIFEDNHTGLHTLADALAETDRQQAGELLRAKQEVESVIGRATEDRLHDLLVELAVVTADAEEGDPPSCS